MNVLYGIMEYRNNGRDITLNYFPSFHYSIIPIHYIQFISFN